MSLSYSTRHREIDHELEHVARLYFKSEQLEDAYNKQFVESNRSRHRMSCVIGIAGILALIVLDLEHVASKASDLITVSGGIVYLESKNIISNDDLFHLADTVLYQAKDAGRNQFKIINGQDFFDKKEK